MRIVFIGTVEFSLKALEKLIELDANIVGVCTKEKSSFNTDYADLTKVCKANQIPYKYVDNINSEDSVKWIRKLNPDIIFCFGWSSLIKKELLELPKMGIVGYHPANLPKNRGRHPLIWALALGLKKSASTFFFMKEGADDGDILSQKDYEILYEDDARTLYEKVTNLALKQIEEFLPKLENRTFKVKKQDETLANVWRKRSKKDGEIDFRMCSLSIYNLVRALTKPYAGAHVVYKGEDVKIWKVSEEDCDLENIEPGKVLEVKENTILVKCYDKAVRIIEHEFKQLPKVGEYF